MRLPDDTLRAPLVTSKGFGRDVCGALPAGERREWLVTNGIGGYACGTLAGLLTRRYHGLLIAALDPPLGRTLLLTKLDETVVYRSTAYALFANRWADGTVEPMGFHHLERFHKEGTTPVWTFAFADADHRCDFNIHYHRTSRLVHQRSIAHG